MTETTQEPQSKNPLPQSSNQSSTAQKKEAKMNKQTNPKAAKKVAPSNSTPTQETAAATTSSDAGSDTMKQVHLTLQGKGGVGKSFVSSLLTQYLSAQGEPVVAVDTDPVNATLAGYQAFGTERLELMEDGSLVERKFDALMERIVTDDSNFVVDNGAASFIPLSYYIAENDAINLVSNYGKQVVVHTVITGGQAMMDTLAGFVQLVEQMPENTRIVVWLNEFFGDIEADGKTFEAMKAYANNKDRVHGIVRIARQTGSTFGKDVQMMLDAKMTFVEIANSPDFGLMSKTRLAQVKKSIFEQLANVI